MEHNTDVELLNGIRSCSNIIKRSSQNNGENTQGYGRLMWAICTHDGMTQAQLADFLDIRPQSLTRALTDLEEKGLIERKRTGKDRRSLTVYPTEEGIEHHRRMSGLREKKAERIFSCLDEQEKEVLLKILNKLVEYHNRSQEGTQQ